MLDRGAFAFLASEMLSRSFHKAAAWAALDATTASRDEAVGDRVRPARPRIWRSRLASLPPVASISTYQGEASARDRACPRYGGCTNSSADARHQLKGRQHAAGRALHLAQQLQRRGGRGHGGESGDRDFGFGKQRRLAAVTMPSVPSAPMKICLRS